MKISIIAVGKIKEKFYREAFAEYDKRLSRYCKLEVIEVADEKTPDKASENVNQQILEKEGERIEKYIPDDAFVIVTAIEGKKYTSEKFADLIEKTGVNGYGHIVFIIGGSLGLTDRIKKRGNALISFSDMTFPHQLMRVILAEQIYRAYRIMNKEPYHK